MAICPNGHDSIAADVCDACGAHIAPSPAPVSIRVVGKHHAGGPRPAGSPDDLCPWCGSPSSDQFCARCGFRVRRAFGPLVESQPAAGPEPWPGLQPSPEPSPLPRPEPSVEPQFSLEPVRSVEPQASLELERSVEPSAAAPAWSAVPPWSAATSWSSVSVSSSSDSPAPPDLPPAPDLPPEPQRPAFLDWFKSPEPEPELEPGPSAFLEPGPSAFLEPEPSGWSETPAVPEPPTVPKPSAAPEPDEPVRDVFKPLNEPVPPGAADPYSWSAHEVPPRSSAAPTAPMPKFTPMTWSVVVTPDRAYYDRMQAEKGLTGADLPFPDRRTERRFALSGKQMRIGRRSAARGTEPEIDLSEPPVDPGISRLHALLLPAPGGFWAVLDPGSANGTLLNGREIPPGDLIPLRDGDRINLGAWTAITIRRQ